MSKAKKSAKKEFRIKIAEQLTTTFGDLKKRVSAKKFERKIQKASKILSEGIKPVNGTESKDKKTKKSTKQTGDNIAATS